MRAFVDTNVLVYLHDRNEETKREQAQTLFLNNDLDLIISSQVLSEFYVTVTRKIRQPLNAAKAKAAVETLAELEVVPVTRNLNVDAVEVSQQHQVSYWDALIIEAASRAGADQLLTEDLNAGSTIRGVTIVNPFAA